MKKIERNNDKLVFNIDGRIVVPSAYMTYITDNAEYDGFYNAGCRMFGLCVYVGDNPVNEESGGLAPFEKGIWVDEETFDFSEFEHNLKKIICNKDDVYVLLRINLNMPKWWRKKYPEELVLFNNGKKAMQSVFSEQWIKDSCRFLKKLNSFIQNSPYKSKVIGWQVAAMHTEEWISPVSDDVCDDFSLPCRIAFQSYLQKKYGNITTVNESWSANYENFEGVEIPSCIERQGWREEKKSDYLKTKIRDYYEFYNNGYADAIIKLLKYVKKIHNGDILTGSFYGYIAQLNCERGHCAIEKLLDCPELDYFASPFAYIKQRAKAIDWSYHAPMDTIRENGKMWFLEADVRTHLTKPPYKSAPYLLTEKTNKKCYKIPVWQPLKNEKDSINNILRSFSKILISGNAFWWFDMWGGWYNSERIMQLMSKLYGLYSDEFYLKTKSVSKIAVVLDSKTTYYVNDEKFYSSVLGQIIELGFLGAPYELYLKSQVLYENLKNYKIVIYTCPNAFDTNGAELIKKLERSGTKVLFTGNNPLNASNFESEIYDRKQLFNLANECGVHVFSYGNIVYANDRFISVTATKTGVVEITTPNDCEFYSVAEGESYKTMNKKIVFKCKKKRL